MELAGCIPLLLQFFLHLSTYTDLLHLSLNHSHVSCNLFPPFHPSSAMFTFFIPFMYHCLHQNMFLRLSQNMTIPPCTICPCQLIFCFLQSQHINQLNFIPLVHQLYTGHHFHHRSFCSSQSSHFIFLLNTIFHFYIT